MNSRSAEYPLPQTARRVPLRRRLLRSSQVLLHLTSVDEVYARVFRKSGAVILMYHSVARPDVSLWLDPRNHLPGDIFRRHMQFLRRNRRVVPLGELVEALAASRTLERGAVVITFDDGYLDNLEVAAPILAEFDLPATVFLATGYVGRVENQWIDCLYAAFATRTQNRLAATWADGAQFHLGVPDQCTKAYHDTADRLVSASLEERRDIQGSVEKQLAPELGGPRLTMNWSEARRLASQYPNISIGGHTRNHIDLTSVDMQQAEQEVRGCAEDIERELGVKPKHFAFPYNRRSPALSRTLAECGFDCGVCAGPEVLTTSKASCYALNRIEAPGKLLLLAHVTSGAYPELSLRLTGRM